MPSLSTDIVPSLHHLSSWIGHHSFYPPFPLRIRPACSDILIILLLKVNYSAYSSSVIILLTRPRTSCKDWLNTIFDVFQIAKNYYYSHHYAMHSTTMELLQSATSTLTCKAREERVCQGLCNDRCVRIWAQRERYCRKLKDSLCSMLCFCTHCGTISSHVTMQLGDCCCSTKDSYSVKGLSGIMEFIAANPPRPLRLLSAIKNVVSVKLITLMA